MENSPLLRAHAAVERAESVLRTATYPDTVPVLLEAASYHAEAAALFEEAKGCTKDVEVLRMLDLLIADQLAREDRLSMRAKYTSQNFTDTAKVLAGRGEAGDASKSAAQKETAGHEGTDIKGWVTMIFTKLFGK